MTVRALRSCYQQQRCTYHDLAFRFSVHPYLEVERASHVDVTLAAEAICVY